MGGQRVEVDELIDGQIGLGAGSGAAAAGQFGMHGHDRGPAACVAKLDVAASLAHLLEASPGQNSDGPFPETTGSLGLIQQAGRER